jgi:serpin B
MTVSRRKFLAAAAAAGLTPLAARQAFAAATPLEIAKPVADANAAFGCYLYAELAKKDAGKNLFFSPLSIEAALAMTATGAKGNTFDEMQKTLRLPKDEAATDAGFKQIFAKINDAETPADKRGYALSLANAIYAQKGFPWEKAFTDRVSAAYGAGVIDADFKSDFEKERLRINGWVEDQTNMKIKDLLAKGVLDKLTRMVLVNAVYFKGDWESAFKKDVTKDQPFFLADGGKVDAPLMYQRGTFSLYQDESLQALELPYKAGQMAMVAVLPRKKDGLADLEKAFTPANLATWTASFRDQGGKRIGRGGGQVDVYLPKFKVETSYGLNKPLKSLGMADAFDEAKADFSRMSPAAKSVGLHVSAVVHKAFVDVNEEGTEAAAATAVVMSMQRSAAPATPVFRADHPFVFLLVHKPTNAILFQGRVTNPKG